MFREDKSAKVDYTLLQKEPLDRWAKRRQFGVDKYGSRDDWQNELKEQGPARYLSSALRHLIQYIYGDRSEDHLGAVMTNIGFVIWHEDNADD